MTIARTSTGTTRKRQWAVNHPHAQATSNILLRITNQESYRKSKSKSNKLLRIIPGGTAAEKVINYYFVQAHGPGKPGGRG